MTKKNKEIITAFLDECKARGYDVERAATGSIYVRVPGKMQSVRISDHSTHAAVGSLSRNSSNFRREVSTKWTGKKLEQVLADILDGVLKDWPVNEPK